MTSSSLSEAVHDHSNQVVTRLLVSWRDPEARTYRPIGFLDCTANGYEFAYLRSVVDLDGFRPLLGFTNVRRRYLSAGLFPIFGERVMDSTRPDRPRWLDSLGLDGDPPPMEVLARSGGHRLGDTIELSPVPRVDADGTTSCTFLAHGVRYHAGAEERIAKLNIGDDLLLVDCPENEFNHLAIAVASDDHIKLGWVPDPLLDYVHDVRDQGGEHATVLRANGGPIDPHLRLLVQLTGRLPIGSQPFTGPEWETII
jgi:hypothetical protein